MWMMIVSSFIVPMLMFVCGCIFKRRAPKKKIAFLDIGHRHL